MNPPENPTGKKGEPYTIIATVKSRWKSSASIISIGLLVVSLVLAIVNGLTYWNIADNYKIRNRPFVKIEAHRMFVIKNKEVNIKGGQLNTPLAFKLKIENFGLFPAVIEDIDIWFKNIPKDFVMPKGEEHNTTTNFALFQNEVMEPKPLWTFLLGDNDIEKITKAKEPLYVVLKINYKILGDGKNSQKVPFSYWAKYVSKKVDGNQEMTVYRFFNKECGINDIYPDT